MLRTSDLDFDLPDSQIATTPIEPRDACRLMAVGRRAGGVAAHAHFRDLARWLRPHDVLVFNRTRVVAARLAGVRRGTGGKVGGLFLRECAPGSWLVMLTAGGKLSPGTVIDLHPPGGAPGSPEFSLTLEAREAEGWRVCAQHAVTGEPVKLPAARVLERAGATPLPPYILDARRARDQHVSDAHDRDQYQTVYAAAGHEASVAAPTAGMHFTPELLQAVAALGVRTEEVFLSVGLGTFKPVQTEFVEQHPIHAEAIEVPARTLAAIESARAKGGRAIAVGTTTVRALESVPNDWSATGESDAYRIETRLLITPGFTFRRVDGLVTNFHLPRSTLLAMVGALLEGGPAELLGHYRQAVALEYRFFSYGDAMLILD